MNEKTHSDEKSGDKILGIPDYDKDKCAEINQIEKGKSSFKENSKSSERNCLNIQTGNKTQIAGIKKRENPDPLKTKIIKTEATVESGLTISGKGRSNLNVDDEKSENTSIQLRAAKKEKKKNTKEKKRDISEVERDKGREQKFDEKAKDRKIEKIFEIPEKRRINQDVMVDQIQPGKKDLEPSQSATSSVPRNLLENEKFQYNFISSSSNGKQQ